MRFTASSMRLLGGARCLSTGKNGISFSQEGPQALGAVLRILGQGKLVHVSVAGGGIEGVGVCVDRCLAQANPVGRQRGGAACHLQGGLHRRAVRYHLLDQAPVHGAGGVELFSSCEEERQLPSSPALAGGTERFVRERWDS